ncbi:MAG: DUF3343 domain-containing protein [Spirochaetes bacterium]|nr:DUF3343 domain-containing protein [Spirochaetota bacterium]
MRRRKKTGDATGLDGIVTFFSSHHALHAEEVLKKTGLRTALVPGPREISPNCGVALRFQWEEKKRVESLFAENRIQYERVIFLPVA